MILTIRTDNPQAEVGLYDGLQQKEYKKWQAHRELSSTIHETIKKLLRSQKKDWQDVSGVVFYEGPGSFTGLRIGASIANALAIANQVPVVSSGTADWQEDGIHKLNQGEKAVALPKYGAGPHITKPKK